MLAFLIGAAVAAATPAQLPPVDRCQGDAGFDRFRAALDDAVARKDPAALRKLTADDIRVDFGGGGGWKDFSATWDLSDPKNSRLWAQLKDVVAGGCAKTEAGGRVFPGMFEDMGDESDPFELVVARPGAVLRSAATDIAAPVATLDWHSARLVEEPLENPFVKVALIDGREGWLHSSDLLSPLGHRLVVERRGGRWLIAALVAGD